jgi:thymidine phosphorylase
MLPAPRSGYISAIDAEGIGYASMLLGAGRFKKGDPIDHRTGFILQAKSHTFLNTGDPLIEIHARSAAEVQSIRERVLSCYSWSDEVPTTTHNQLIYDIIRP